MCRDETNDHAAWSKFGEEPFTREDRMTSPTLGRRRRLLLALSIALPVLTSCGGSAPTAAEEERAGFALPNDVALPADRIVLRAWEDTRVGLPPLAVTRSDSIETVMAFVRARADGWHEVKDVPSNPLPAEFYQGNQVTLRFGIVDVPGDSGFFITWDGSRKLLRPASDAELWTFLGFFGIGGIVVE